MLKIITLTKVFLNFEDCNFWPKLLALCMHNAHNEKKLKSSQNFVVPQWKIEYQTENRGWGLKTEATAAILCP